MADQKALNSFMKNVLLAAKKQEEKKIARTSLHDQIKTVKKIAGSKKIKKDELKISIKELESKLNKVIEKEGDLVASAEKEHHTSEELKGKIKDLEENILKISARDFRVIENLKNHIHELDQELKINEDQRSEELELNRQKIDQLRSIISELKSKITKAIEIKAERERRIAEFEKKIKQEADKNKHDIDNIEDELAKLRKMEEEKPVSFFERLSAFFRKKPKIEDFVKPEEKVLFEEKIPKPPVVEKRMPEPPIPKIKPMIRQRPLVNHDILFGETKAIKGIPMDQRDQELPSPPVMPLLSSPPVKKSFFEELKDFFRKKK